MTINLHRPDIAELKPRITVFGVGGGGGNAVNNMINAGLQGVDFVVANTDAQALAMSKAERVIQLGAAVTEGLGAGALPEVGQAAADECIDEIIDHLADSHMVFITAGMGGGTGTGAAPVVARAAREKGILTVGVVTKPFQFEGARRMKTAEAGIEELQKSVDTLIVIPNQNLFRIANEKTTFADAFAMADQVLYSGVASITDLMIKEGLINLDFADVRSVMHEMGRAMMGTGEASGEGRALAAAEAAIANPLLDETSMCGARGLLISITGGRDMTLFEVDEAANRIREEVDADANVIFGAIDDESLEGVIRVSVVATGIDRLASDVVQPSHSKFQKSVSSVRKNDSGINQTASHPQSSQLRSESMVETIESLEVEVSQSQPVEEMFSPKSQIFAKPTDTASTSSRSAATYPFGHGQSDIYGKISNASRIQVNSIPQQSTAAAVSMEATAHVLSEMTNIVEQSEEKQAQIQPYIAPARMPELKDFSPFTHGQGIHSSGLEQGPRSLWQRLKQSLTYREEIEPEARLEPAVKPLQNEESHIYNKNVQKVSSQDSSVYAPHRSTKLQSRALQDQRAFVNEEDQLEIPAFLRRQAN
ncbi:cell division protein ftsZ [Bartonella bacilliformis str. Heidi Mejia]|uniref:Cell division protein FtsZ n=8 Tax=Bartonella TaxID=773 RepID=FTSZ_BARBA|nr:cell division protein FtsZ [Bartonella bacilliformis]O31314.2 RecName: Full=Cell division protein FtsZ; AltName: Full=75 kDa antigen [Bartonella bacilliformis]AAT38536.1 FtsZ [Bartonella bacilliformis]ABM44997.1 cell division protein FtsZ [Bartonella bacilliformis KC583]AMG85993.1 cell division protein FtsZ [Bartonella bacilliformis]EKS43482.1 cell division protein FtsZ [Bartonella bacilliformis INS]EYS89690.1 cell division protein ftsZ [Bartonella bacilliformis San Pedro600-02]